MKDLLSRRDLKGIRVLAQEPLETTLAFICSANNNIKRISRKSQDLSVALAEMVGRLAEHYGERLLDEESTKELPSSLLFDFPSLDTLYGHASTLEGTLLVHFSFPRIR